MHEDSGVVPSDFSYSIDPATNGASNDLFAIDGSTGVITLDQLVPDFEDTSSYVIAVIAGDSRGLTTTASVNITVLNVIEPPTMSDASFSVDENEGTGTSIGTMTVRVLGMCCIHRLDVYGAHVSVCECMY